MRFTGAIRYCYSGYDPLFVYTLTGVYSAKPNMPFALSEWAKVGMRSGLLQVLGVRRSRAARLN